MGSECPSLAIRARSARVHRLPLWPVSRLFRLGREALLWIISRAIPLALEGLLHTQHGSHNLIRVTEGYRLGVGEFYNSACSPFPLTTVIGLRACVNSVGMGIA